jgi:hypothetical protein
MFWKEPALPHAPQANTVTPYIVKMTLMEIQSNISLIYGDKKDFKSTKLQNQAMLVFKETSEITISTPLIFQRLTLELRAVK